ncbi:MAG: hypothetical protein A3G25_19180 [Betaproteobacteria bacterium RIFCSPLOWO2_12_FULL_63_13]|nr:MAG: hypothetical protein A3H32_14910 [Betaproteobacteria bacterium RIFCSPLOWO2_02_FULL_63_19]OGA42653.1 MAG: hypothetical protein A3G25_19180 [Betaproteobacteria bacterium RIFCSPLOWO2_12_FULL_63_13]
MKYRFRIRTRHGLVVENLVIHGRDEADAQRKLRQMYQHCEVTECMLIAARQKSGSMSFEDVVSLLTK